MVERDREEHDQLVRAARVVLARGGWWGFKVESVIREARLSTRSFYRHFEKKDQLLLHMLQQDVERGARRLELLMSAASEPLDRVEAYCVGVLDMAYDERIAKPTKIFSWHWHELSAEYPKEIVACIATLTAPLVTVLEGARASGALPHIHPDNDATAIFHLVGSLSTHALSSGGEIPREHAIDVAFGFVRRALVTPSDSS